MTPNDAEVRALLDVRVDACRAKDIDRLMALYAPDSVYFDVVPPLRYTGAAAIRRNFERWFAEFDGPLGLEAHDLAVAAGPDTAFAHMLHRSHGRRTSGFDGALWLRATVCCRRSNGAWSITHEHVSLPVDPRTRTAWFAPEV